MQTSEAERIGINQIAKVLPRGNDKSSDQREYLLSIRSIHALANSHQLCCFYYSMPCKRRSLDKWNTRSCMSCRKWQMMPLCCAVAAQYASLHAAIKMLHSRLALLMNLLAGMQKGMINNHLTDIQALLLAEQ